MKNKYITAFLAFFFPVFGIHRFYLEERGNGVAYFLLTFVGIGVILSYIDAVLFLFMDTEKFDYRYNNKGVERKDFDRKAFREYNRRQTSQRQSDPRGTRRVVKPKRATSSSSRAQVHIKAGKDNYTEFDYFEAISQWQKAITIEPRNAAVHYNLACAYSLTEQAKESFFHLSEAVKYGFNNFEKLNNQDALAFLRIQEGFEKFAADGYLLKSSKPSSTIDLEKREKDSILSKDILEQLKELGELRDRGILTEEEFAAQKRKLI